MVEDIRESGIPIFADSYLSKNKDIFEEFIKTSLETTNLKIIFKNYFIGYKVTDIFQEINEIIKTSKVKDNTEFYLNIGEIVYNKTVFPICFFPLEILKNEQVYDLKTEPILYFNKRAIDYFVQEINQSSSISKKASIILERILYLEPTRIVNDEFQSLFDNLLLEINEHRKINFNQNTEQTIAGLDFKINNSLNISLFDKSEESMVNDYESIQLGKDGGEDVKSYFEEIINNFITSNPVSVNSTINRIWDETETTDRLVFDSPLPLVEEQRKILSAINDPNSRFISVEGPPGTGKSHTISVIAFNSILSNKSILILSDKKRH